jgi:beta-lactamase superfamily II metal-dependent hydrolase
MRSTLVCLAALATLAGCQKRILVAQQPEGTTGGEIIARRATVQPRPDMSTVESRTMALTHSELDIFVIDVGQGDSTLIVGPLDNGKRFTMLIDAGIGSSATIVEPALEQLGVTELDVVIATHYDADHVGGLTAVSGTSLLWTTTHIGNELASCATRPLFPTLALVDPGPSPGNRKTEQEWDHCSSELAGGSSGPEHIEVVDGDHIGRTFELGGSYAATIVAGGGHVLGTQGQLDNANSKNEMSVAILLSNEEGFDFLVTGDLIGQPLESGSGPEDAALEAALGEGLEAIGVDVEVLRTGHHGAENATESSFIAKIQPEVAIISVGSNTHGHPAKRTLETLDNNDVPLILQTGAGTPEESHAFEDCGVGLDCTQTLQVIVNGTIHIGVIDDVYFITALPAPDAETLSLLLECDALGCEGLVE